MEAYVRAPSNNIRKEDLYVYLIVSVLGIFECAIWPCSLCCKCVAVPGDISIILSNSINSGAKTLASQVKYVFCASSHTLGPVTV